MTHRITCEKTTRQNKAFILYIAVISMSVSVKLTCNYDGSFVRLRWTLFLVSRSVKLFIIFFFSRVKHRVVHLLYPDRLAHRRIVFVSYFFFYLCFVILLLQLITLAWTESSEFFVIFAASFVNIVFFFFFGILVQKRGLWIYGGWRDRNVRSPSSPSLSHGRPSPIRRERGIGMCVYYSMWWWLVVIQRVRMRSQRNFTSIGKFRYNNLFLLLPSHVLSLTLPLTLSLSNTLNIVSSLYEK